MDPGQTGRQMLDFNRTAFENSFSAMCTLQDQAEKVFNAYVEQSPWFPKELARLTADWIKSYKQGRDQFKETADANFRKIDEFLAGIGGGKAKTGR
jgi:hypothetical protein